MEIRVAEVNHSCEETRNNNKQTVGNPKKHFHNQKISFTPLKLVNITGFLILLDLNMPKMYGREVLEENKSDNSLSKILVVVLTTSQHEVDIANSYNQKANCYITKPVEFDQFVEVLNTIEQFWFSFTNSQENPDTTDPA